MREIVVSQSAPAPIGPYSQAIRAGGFLFVSGQIPLDPSSGNVVGASTGDQTRQVLKNLSAILEAAGSGLDKVVKTTIYVIDLGDFGEMNAVYSEFFGDSKPARATVQVARLPRDVRVEIEAVALV